MAYILRSYAAQTVSLRYGVVKVGEDKKLSITYQNLSDDKIIFTSVKFLVEWTWEEDFSGIFDFDITFPLELAAAGESGDSVTFDVTFAPDSEATIFRRAWLYYYREGLPEVSRAAHVLLYGDGAIAPTLALSVQPGKLVFPDTQIDEESEIQEITVANVSEDTSIPAIITISDLEIVDHFEFVDPPSTPFELAAGESVVLKVKFAPTAQGDHSDYDGVVITGDDPDSPHSVILVGYCFITAIDPVVGHDVDTLMAFAFGATPTVTVKEADSSDLDCEEIQFCNKAFYFDAPGLDKILTDFYMKYEDLGVATLKVKIERRMLRGDNVISQQKSISLGSAGADERPLLAQASGFLLDAEILHVVLYKDAASGPMSIVDFIYKYLLMEKLIGSTYLPRLTSGTGYVDPSSENALACFYVDSTGVTSAKKALGGDLNCEEDAYMEKLTTFSLDNLEKAIMRMWLKIEDLGQCTVSLTLTSPRGDDPEAPVEITFGGDADEEVLNAAFNVIYSGELINIRFDRAASEGPLSMLSYNTKFEPRGELVEE
jgi:hypothetical protein